MTARQAARARTVHRALDAVSEARMRLVRLGRGKRIPELAALVELLAEASILAEFRGRDAAADLRQAAGMLACRWRTRAVRTAANVVDFAAGRKRVLASRRRDRRKQP
jgi:hypothetical protein